MILEIMLRRRAKLDEKVPEINTSFVEKFFKTANFWMVGKHIADAVFDPGTGESATLDLRKALVPELKGQIVYAARLAGYLNRDIAQSDDFLALRLNAEKADYRQFCTQTFPALIGIFQPYRAAIETDIGVAMADWEVVREQSQETGRDVDGRDSVFRIWPSNFFDDELCRRSFGIGASDVVRRVSAECERAEVLYGGAFLLVTSELVVGAALDELHSRMMSRLV